MTTQHIALSAPSRLDTDEVPCCNKRIDVGVTTARRAGMDAVATAIEAQDIYDAAVNGRWFC